MRSPSVSTMASTSNRAESSTSSSSLPAQYYDVFLSFRGDDTRKNFTDHLYAALVRHGFYTYRDDDKLERGEEIGSELLKAIERSRVSVIVFSRHYAHSRWCLDELVKILECKSTLRQMVVPVFYDADPSDVRAQRGSFAEAFGRHQERYKGGGMEGKMQRWRAALTEAANLSGWHLESVANGHESKFIERIVEDISNKLNLAYSNVATYPVGIESRVENIKKLLRMGSDIVCMVGIWGIGGIGKTTIAKSVYNLMRLKFEGSSFLANVREISKQPNGLVGLQEQLLSDILLNKNQNIRNVDQGIEVIKRRLWCRRVLLVLDDVDDFYQLKALAIRRDWFRSGSRIIITTRDESLLKFLEVDEVYMPKLLDQFESLQLFSWHAFRKDHPIEDYVEHSEKVVGYAGGLPLALEVLGSFLFDKGMPLWKSTLEKLKVIPDDAIQEKLKISFDSLSYEEKDLFLDISCFFIGMVKNDIIKILESYDFFPKIGIAILSRRCLVKIDELNRLCMHDMLRDMGREIVRRECLEEPGKRSRLWYDEDVLGVLTNHTGTEAVEGLVLNLPMSSSVKVNAQTFAKMNKLRLLKLNYLYVTGSYEHISKRLRWICWYGFPLKSIPPNLFLEKVVAIDMQCSSLEQVWKGAKTLNKLRFLNLSHSFHLTKTPDFSGLTSLEILLLNDCTSLVEVHESIECLDKLVVLNLENCKNLRKLPPGVFKLKSLENLHLTGCSKIEKLPGFKESQSKSWFSRFSSWALPMRNPNSSSLSSTSIQGLISIRVLDLGDCNFSCVPDDLGSLIKLRVLNLHGNSFHSLPASISHLSRLETLSLNQCPRLQSLPELPINLKKVNANHCTSLERISIGLNSRASPYLTFIGCHKLVENNLASNFRKSLLQSQGLSALGDLNIFLPGGEVPDLFNYQSEGSILSFVVSPLPDRKIQGWILCANFASPTDEIGLGVETFYYVKNYTKDIMKVYEPTIDGFPKTRQDLTWLHYAAQHHLEFQMEAGDEVEFIVVMDAHVKKCGVNLIYEDDEKDYLSNDQAMIQYDSPSYQEGILDEDVSADQAVIDNKIMATAEGNGGNDPTQQSRSLALKRGRPSHEEKGKAIATESDEWSPTHCKKRSRGTGIVIVDHVVAEVPEAPSDSGLPEVAPGLEAPPDCAMSKVKPGLDDGSNDGVGFERERSA